ncbi:MAG TPA: glycosyltransferase [Candidatus Angelobacter sp.]|nr:glycosyltransferase [Candidatus Angelobacter sp.]
MSNAINNLAVSPETATSGPDSDAPPHKTAGTKPDSRCHILFIIDELCEIGGAERVLFKMIELLPTEKFRCSLLTFRTNDEADLSQIRCPVYVMPLRRTYDWNALKVARQIRNFVRRENVLIAHTFFETSDLWAGPIAKLSGCPVLISSRRDLGILRSRRHNVGYRVLRRMYDSVLAVSPQVRDFCIQQDGLDPARVQTLFNGLDMECAAAPNAESRIVMRKQMNIPDHVPVITTVGNIRKVKGIDVLVEAAVEVSRARPDSVFLVVGRKSEEDHCRELEARIASLGLATNFRLLGSREDVFAILRMSDIFCLPSRSEGFSNALLEAMACRLPCVATDVGGNPEVLTHGETGLLVPIEDSAALARALMQLLSDRSLAGRMGLRAERVVESRFTSQAMMNTLVSVYQGLLAAKERG